jgi:hypothetical protein
MLTAAVVSSAITGAAIVTWSSAEQTAPISVCGPNSFPNRHATCSREAVAPRETTWAAQVASFLK